MNISSSLVKSTAVAALGGLLFGFDTAVIAGATSQLTAAFSLDPTQLGITVSSALIGTIFGAMLAGIPGDRLGRRDSLRLMAVLYVISALGCAVAWNWPALIFFRFIGGLGIGGSSVLGPMYIAEIAPAKWRGRLVGFFQLNIVAGILLAYFSNYVLGLQGFGDAEWRWKLGVSAAPAVLFFLMLFTIPRSPRWLVKKGRVPEARTVLQQIGERNVEAALQDIVGSIDALHGHAEEPLFQAKFKLPIFLAVTIGMFNQFSGINAILYYLNDIFAAAGFTKVSGDLQAVAIGFTNLTFTMIAMTMIDRLGRKKLLLTGAVGCAACLAGVALVFASGARREFTGVAAHRVHCVLRLLARRRDLGLLGRGFPHQRARQRSEFRQLHALGDERGDILRVSSDCGELLEGRSLRLLRSHDSGAVRSRPDDLSRD